MKNKIIALIPAKYKSSSLKNKNLKKIRGKSLIQITLDQVKKIKLIDEIFINTEEQKLKKIAKNNKVNFFLRNKKYAKKNTPSNYVIKDFIVKKKLNNDVIIVYLQPTSPMRKEHHIKKAVSQFLKSKNTSLVSVKKIETVIFKTVKRKQKLMTPTFKEKYLTMNRQDFPEIFIPNGAIYIFKVGNFKRKWNIPLKLFKPFVMNEIDSIDIDTPQDLKRAKQLKK